MDAASHFKSAVKQVMREAFKRDTRERRAATARARLIEKAEASGYSSARGVNPLERAALVSRLRKPEMTDDEIDEIIQIVEVYLSGRLCAADWRLWLRRRAVPQADQRRIGRRGRRANPLVNLAMFDDVLQGRIELDIEIAHLAAIGGRAAVV
jgi:hypothetical protein